MKSRIAIWASVGALVAVFWGIYVVSTRTNTLATPGVLSGLADLTCPIVLLRHHAVSLDQVLIANAATYALVGVIMEAIRRRSQTLAIPH
jgi:hypothetical protein